MRILELTDKPLFKIYEAPDSEGSSKYIMHGQYYFLNNEERLNPDVNKIIRNKEETFVWLYDLRGLLGLDSKKKYTPGDWWDGAGGDSSKGSPYGVPDFKKIADALGGEDELEKQGVTSLEDFYTDFIPKHPKVSSGAWHRIGGNNEPFNIGRSATNTKFRNVVAELIYTRIGDPRFKPNYDSKTDTYNYSEVASKVDVITSSGKVNGAERESFQKLQRDNTKKFNDNKPKEGGLIHNKVYTMKPSMVQFKYISEYDDPNDPSKTIKMQPFKYPHLRDHQPHFIRVADGKRVKYNSIEHATICAYLGYEADTITQLEPTASQKFKEYWRDKVGPFSTNLDPKAPIITKVLTRGVHDPLSNLVFSNLKNSVNKKYGDLKKAYSWQRGQDNIKEDDETKKSIIYWENKISELSRGANPSNAKSDNIDLLQAHINAYEDEIKLAEKSEGFLKNLDSELLLQAKQNIEKYKKIMVRYYGGNFMKGDIVVIEPDAKLDKGLTINFKGVGVVRGPGTQGKTGLPYLQTDQNGQPVINNSGVAITFKNEEGRELSRTLNAQSSVLVKLQIPEAGLDINKPQGPTGNGFYFETGEANHIKKGIRTVEEAHKKYMEELKRQAEEERDEEQPQFDTDEEFDNNTNEEANEGAGGDPEELNDPTGGPVYIKHRELKPGSLIAWKGVSGTNKGKEVKGRFLEFDPQNPDVLLMQSLNKKWLYFKLHISHVTDVLNKSGTKTGTSAGSRTQQYRTQDDPDFDRIARQNRQFRAQPKTQDQ